VLDQQFPHVGADIVKAKILLGFHVEEDDLVLQSLINDIVAFFNSCWRHFQATPDKYDRKGRFVSTALTATATVDSSGSAGPLCQNEH
jgi:hypothetical protein